MFKILTHFLLETFVISDDPSDIRKYKKIFSRVDLPFNVDKHQAVTPAKLINLKRKVGKPTFSSPSKLKKLGLFLP